MIMSSVSIVGGWTRTGKIDVKFLKTKRIENYTKKVFAYLISENSHFENHNSENTVIISLGNNEEMFSPYLKLIFFCPQRKSVFNI